MELKPARDIATSALAAVMGMLLLAYEVFVVVRVVTTGDWKGLFTPLALFGMFFVAIVALITPLLLVMPWIVLKRRQNTRALANRNPAQVSIAPAQPDHALALRNGESLVLSYHRGGSKWRQLPRAIGLCLFMAASGEVLIIAALPVFTHSSLNPFYFAPLNSSVAPATPSPLDWLAVAFPLVVCGMILVYWLWDIITGRMVVLTADDQGVRLRTRRRSKAIPWNDIVLFAHTMAHDPTNPIGAYVLWGRSHRLEFSIANARGTNIEPSSDGQSSRYVFEGGYAAYLENAQRLLATIAVRAHTPLLVTREAPVIGWLRRRAPVAITSEDEAAVLPTAEQVYQPQVGDSATVLRFGEQLILRERLAPWPVLAESLLWMVVLGPPLYFCASMQSAFTSVFSLGPIATVSAVVFSLLMLGLLAVSVAAGRRGTFRPAIRVDGFGIATRAQNEKKPVMIPWQSVTAWVVIPASPGANKPTRYIVFGDGKKITWAESTDAQLAGKDVRGNRQQAFRERAARIHAVIASRTGLPLRELQPDAPLPA